MRQELYGAGRRVAIGGADKWITELIADWMTLHIDEKPAADMFYTAYMVKDDNPQRDITYDTVTPFLASKRIMYQGRLKPQVKARITEKLYEGGHMFYAWHEQRQRFCDDVREFVLGTDNVFMVDAG